MREADALLDAGKGPYHQEREPEEEDEVIAWPLNLLPPGLWSEREASLFQPPSPPPITPPCPPKGNRKKRKRTESPVPMPQGKKKNSRIYSTPSTSSYPGPSFGGESSEIPFWHPPEQSDVMRFLFGDHLASLCEERPEHHTPPCPPLATPLPSFPSE
ncbi:uncharacterized protein LOC118180582, partial [Stegodyphus dumicola]|uniref:uncharacterized protein LOC118180582 n=1 Tax=Stegodyphus dumicola TaxID=202533 RepID=UPI0015B1CFF4